MFLKQIMEPGRKRWADHAGEHIHLLFFKQPARAPVGIALAAANFFNMQAYATWLRTFRIELHPSKHILGYSRACGCARQQYAN